MGAVFLIVTATAVRSSVTSRNLNNCAYLTAILVRVETARLNRYRRVSWRRIKVALQNIVL